MCGIIAYFKWNKTSTSNCTYQCDSNKIKDNLLDIILTALERLEYRGYDSAGLVMLQELNELVYYREQGNISKLRELTKLERANFNNDSKYKVGLGHTRWATHGPPSVENAHPHRAKNLYIVHNGIIENYLELKSQLNDKNIKFTSQTDSEILGYWLEQHWSPDINTLISNISKALSHVRGTFGVAIMDINNPEQLIAIRRGSPIIIGKNGNEYYISSDSAALSGSVRNIIYLEDDEMAICKPNHFEIVNLKNIEEKIEREMSELESSDAYDEFGNVIKTEEHFLIKEIKEQSSSVKNILLGRINPDTYDIKIGGLLSNNRSWDWLEHLIILGCGSAYYAGMTAKYILGDFLNMSINAELASEYRYLNCYVPNNSMGIIVSQSGETADTLASLKLLKDKNIYNFGLINVVGSTISREVDSGLYLHAGPEFSVASTKAFTNQVIAILLVGCYFKQSIPNPHYNHPPDTKHIIKQLQRLPSLFDAVFDWELEVINAANNFKDYKNALYLGRHSLHPIALEGALKMKEIAYIHAEGFSASELKHGPIALIDQDYFIVYLLQSGPMYSKSFNNLQQVLARLPSCNKGNEHKPQLLLITDTHDDLVDLEDKITIINLNILNMTPWQQPFIFNVILQLLAYHVARLKGCNVDQPRHLAKSVTVE